MFQSIRAWIFTAAVVIATVASSEASAITWSAGGWQKNEAAGMSFWLYVPRSAAGSSPSLVLQLHGCFSSADKYKEFANWPAAAERHRLVIAIPQLPEETEINGCWDAISGRYETTRHTALLAGLVDALKAEPALAIDAGAVYAAGLSAGATQSMLLGCARPDLFAGVALAAGPMLSSPVGEVFNPGTSAEDVARACVRVAGDRAALLQSLKISIIVGDSDWLVNPVHSQRTFAAMKSILQATRDQSFDLNSLPGARRDGTGTIAFDSAGRARVSYIVQNGLGHAWPAGYGKSQPGNPSSFNGNSIDYPLYLGAFFSERIR